MPGVQSGPNPTLIHRPLIDRHEFLRAQWERPDAGWSGRMPRLPPLPSLVRQIATVSSAVTVPPKPPGRGVVPFTADMLRALFARHGKIVSLVVMPPPNNGVPPQPLTPHCLPRHGVPRADAITVTVPQAPDPPGQHAVVEFLSRVTIPPPRPQGPTTPGLSCFAEPWSTDQLFPSFWCFFICPPSS